MNNSRSPRNPTSDDIDHGDGHISVGWAAAVAAAVCLSDLNCMKYVFYANFLLSERNLNPRKGEKISTASG